MTSRGINGQLHISSSSREHSETNQRLFSSLNNKITVTAYFPYWHPSLEPGWALFRRLEGFSLIIITLTNTNEPNSSSSMHIFSKRSFGLAAMALFSPIVEGAISFQIEVQCLLEAPEICIGEQVEYSPSPAIECVDLNDPNSCKTIYMGGYGWEYSFVEGLDEGTTNEALIEYAKTGLEVKVTVEDDKETCEVAVGDVACQSCSAQGCSSSGTPEAVRYDCTNLENGSISLECVPLEPFLYPFSLESPEEDTAATTKPTTASNGNNIFQSTGTTEDNTDIDSEPTLELSTQESKAASLASMALLQVGLVGMGMVIFLLGVGNFYR